MDSEVEGEEHDDVRLSQSSTDTGVNIELPGFAIERDGGKSHVADEEECTVGSGDRHDKGVVERIESTGIVESQMTDTPTAPGEVATPVLPTGENVAVTPLSETASRKVLDTTSTPVVANEIKSDDRRRILRDVGAAELMRAEIAKTNPEFASVSAFIGAVCGERRVTGKDEVVDSADVEEVPINIGSVLTGRSQEQEQRYLERQRLTRITAAKLLLKEELGKKKTVEAVINASGKAAGDGDDVVSLDTRQRSDNEERAGVLTGSELPLVEGELTQGRSEIMEEIVEIESEMEVTGEVQTVISEDVEMSNAESEEEGSEYGSSDESSESSESEESLASTRSRKRPAEGSPEREPPETIRKEFRVQ